MQNLSHARPQVKTSITISRTRTREKVTLYSLGPLILFMTTDPWNTADAASDMFERRYFLMHTKNQASFKTDLYQKATHKMEIHC